MDTIQTLDPAGARKQPTVGSVGRPDVGGSDIAAAEFLTALHAIDRTAPAEPNAAISDAPVSEEDRDIAAEAEVLDLSAWALPMPIAIPSLSIKFSGGESDHAVNAPPGGTTGKVVTEPEPPASDPTVRLTWPAPDARTINVPEAEIMFGADAGKDVFGGSVDKPKLLQYTHPPSDPVVRRISFETPAPDVAEPVATPTRILDEKPLPFGRESAENGDGRVGQLPQPQPTVAFDPRGKVDPQPILAVPVATVGIKRPVVADVIPSSGSDAMPHVKGAKVTKGAAPDEADVTPHPAISGSTPLSKDARSEGGARPDGLESPVDFSDDHKTSRRPDRPLQDMAPEQLIGPQIVAGDPMRAAARAESFAAHLPSPLPHGLGHQLADAVARLPNRPVEVALSPEELGRVRMTLTMVDGGLTLTLVADRLETLDLMRRHIGQLAQDFRDMGFQNLSFSFAQGQDPRRAPERSLLMAEDDAALAAAPQEIPRPKPMKPLPHIPAEGLDIRI